MASNLLSTLFLAISWSAFVCFAQQSGGSKNGGTGTSLPCVQKLLPCQASLVSRSTTPPPACCIPLKQLIQDDTQCLCNVLNNPEILKALNITQDDALNLAKNCHADADMSLCKTAGGPSPSSSPVTPSPPAASNSSSSTPSKSAAVGLEGSFGEPAAVSLAMFLLLSVLQLI